MFKINAVKRSHQVLMIGNDVFHYVGIRSRCGVVDKPIAL